MNCPYKLPSPRVKVRETQLSKAKFDLHFFKDKTDHEVLGCEFFHECQENGVFHIPMDWCRDMTTNPDFHDCWCRPDWYLKQMKEEYE